MQINNFHYLKRTHNPLETCIYIHLVNKQIKDTLMNKINKKTPIYNTKELNQYNMY